MQKLESPHFWEAVLVAAIISACNAAPQAPSSLAPPQTPAPTELLFSTASEAPPRSIVDLLKDNGGCKLPCWWGIFPGVTTWPAAERLISPLASHVEASEFGAPPDTVIYSAEFPPPLEGAHGIAQMYYVRGNVVTLIWSAPGNVPEYSLASLVTLLGSPKEALLRTVPEPYQGLLPADLLLSYPDLGVVALYRAEARIEGDAILACDFQRPVLWLWNPQEKILLSGIAHQFPAGYLPPDELTFFRPIEQVTDQSTSQFASALRAGEPEVCLETLPANWR